MRVTIATKTSELASEINRHSGFRATVWGRNGLRRVYVKRFRYVSRDGLMHESFPTDYTIYVEFIPGCSPLLTVKEADMQKGPQIECMAVSRALSRIGVHVDCKASPFSVPSHMKEVSTDMPFFCDCLSMCHRRCEGTVEKGVIELGQ